MRFSRFLVILFMFLSYTVFKATQIWPASKGFAIFFAFLFFVTMISGMFVYRAKPAVFEEGWYQKLVWVSFFSMGLWATFVLLSLPMDFYHLVDILWDQVRNGSDVNPEGRQLTFRSLSQSILCISAGLASLGLLFVLRGPKIKHVSIHIPKLEHSLDGLKIAQISDLHVGPTIRTRYVQSVVERINSTEPDLILVTGDHADALPDSIAKHLEPFRSLTSKYGIYYVTGNHEYYWDARGLIEKFADLGFFPLLNANKVISVGGAKVLVAGVTDPVGSHVLEGHTPNLKAAVESSETTHLKILLAHRPDACFQAEPLGFDLQFSGHTHAGQFFPFSLLIGLAHKYSRGLNRHGSMQVYVNPGTGYWGPVNRLGVEPEVTLATLKRA